ncbi:MAG: GspH/FimT family pseudopilin [Betaproteobacteria bacterium]|nr:GspH/FimT family pseudopilin [Betaproteobacteria bacterium]
MNSFPKSRGMGFSLIELMIGVVILGILAAVAMPSFRTWLQNTQIRNAAESIANGLQKARAEAVSRNTNVTFVLGANSSWVVSVVTSGEVIESRSANEGSQNVTRTVLPAGATTITFNNFGAIVANADASATLTQVDLAAVGGNQNLRVTIGVGGNTRMCDPNLAPGSSPRAC